MKIVVFYKTVFGASRQYAEWIAQDAGAEALAFEQATPEILSTADSVVVVSGTYMGQIPAIDFLKKHWSMLRGKKIVVLAVGAKDPEAEINQQAYMEMSDEMRTAVKYFRLPGVWNMDTSKVIDRQNLDPMLKLLI